MAAFCICGQRAEPNAFAAPGQSRDDRRACRIHARLQPEIGERKAEVAELLKPSIVHKIEIGGFDHGLIKSVTVFRYDLLQR
jgi:hypothetical protein